MPMFWAVITMLTAAFAVVANLIGYRIQRGFGGPRQFLRLYVGAMALIHVIAYGALAFTPVDEHLWLVVITPLEALVFVTVWSADPIKDMLLARALREPEGTDRSTQGGDTWK